MKRTLFALALLAALAFASPSFAQTVVTDPANARLGFDHDGQGITGGGFKLYVDTATVGQVLTVTPVSGGYTAPLPALTPGTHELSVSAFNTDVESARSNILAIRIAVVPNVPGNFRLARLLGFGRRNATIIVTAVMTDAGWIPAVGVFKGKYRT